MSKNNTEAPKIKVPEDDIGRRIRQRRDDKNLTQEALSILTKYPEIDPECRGLSRPSIVGYEQGKSLPDARGLRLLATALEVTPSWLVLGKFDDPTQKPDPRLALIDALDKYTLRRAYDLRDIALSGTILSYGRDEHEELDSGFRKVLEKRALEEAKLETKKRNTRI